MMCWERKEASSIETGFDCDRRLVSFVNHLFVFADCIVDAFGTMLSLYFAGAMRLETPTMTIDVSLVSLQERQVWGVMK